MAKGNRETMALRNFRNRSQQTLLHLELVDAALVLANQKAAEVKDRQQPLLKALQIPGKYETLHQPLKQHQQLYNFARGRNVEEALLELYACFTEYLRAVLHKIHQARPLELVRDAAVDLDPAEVAAAGDEATLRQLHFAHAFRNLEVRGSAELLLNRAIEETGIAVDESTRREALIFLEMRNLCLYNGGVADERYARAYGKEVKVAAGNRLPKNIKIGRRAVRGVEKLCRTLDGQFLRHRLLKAS